MRKQMIVAAGVAATALAAPAAANAACANADTGVEEISRNAAAKATICLVNEERANAGRKTLDKVSKLSKAARKHSNKIVRENNFSHFDRNGDSPADRVEDFGYKFSFVAENIATEDTAQEAVDAWMGSKLHRKNILSKKPEDIGAGVALGSAQGPDAGAGTFTLVFAAR
jgi:uncharacterized protein YkwD